MECPQCLAWVPAPQTTCECGEVVREGTPESTRAEDNATTAPPAESPADFQSARKNRKKRKPKTFAFHGTGRALFFISLINFGLTLITFGLYRFWARARVRRYTFAQLSFDSHRFAFHGTGQESFRGFARLVGVGILVALGLGLLVGGGLAILFALLGLPDVLMEPAIGATMSLLSGFLGLVVSTLVLVNGRRYVVSRTSYRGIFFTFDGTIPGYLRAVLPSWLVAVFTFGLAFPYVYAATQNWLTKHTHYGTESFRSEIKGSVLLKTWLFLMAGVAASSLGGAGLVFAAGVLSPDVSLGGVAFLLSPAAGLLCGALAFGVGGCWTEAQFQRHVAASTSFQRARFQSSVTTLGLLKLRTLNFLTLVCTLGVGASFNTARTWRYRAACLGVVGKLNLDAIGQRADARDAMAEGLLDGTDFDIG